MNGISLKCECLKDKSVERLSEKKNAEKEGGTRGSEQSE
jgi:hypothetical protein